MNDTDDLTWLTARKPDVADDDARQAARRDLLRHIESADADRAPQPAPRPAHRPDAPRRWLRPVAGTVAVAAAAAAALTVAVALDGTDATRPGSPADQRASAPSQRTATLPRSTGAATSGAMQLVAFTRRLANAPAPAGNATIIRTTNRDERRLIDGVWRVEPRQTWTLTTDARRDFIGPTRGELLTAVRSGEDFLGDAQITGRQIDAAIQATRLDRDSARRTFLDAWPQAAAQARRGGPALEDETIRILAERLLTGGAGQQPEVRAGALRLLATVEGLRIERRDGWFLLQRLPSAGDPSTSTMWINAESGLPERRVIDDPDAEPRVSETWTSERVQVAAIGTDRASITPASAGEPRGGAAS